jgi:hypothetical protein
MGKTNRAPWTIDLWLGSSPTPPAARSIERKREEGGRREEEGGEGEWSPNPVIPAPSLKAMSQKQNYQNKKLVQ